jgi:thioredoxin reductase
MPHGMLLKSEPFASSLWDPERRLTLERYCQEKRLPYRRSGRPVSLAQFLAYAQWFQERAVPRVEDEEVVSLDRQGQGFAARLASGDSIEATNVVIAIGQRDFRVIPSILKGAPNGSVSHTSDHADLSAFRNRDVTIIGLGQSALETAALLHEQGAKVCVIGRDQKVDWNKQPPEHRSLLRKIRMPQSGLAESWRCVGYCELPQAFRFVNRERRLRIAVGALGPSGAWWLKDRVDGKFRVLTGSEIVAAGAQGNRFEVTVRTDGRLCRMLTDHIMAGTGFEVDIARIPFLARSLLTQIKSYFGYPELNGNMETSLPGLFFAGSMSAFSFGPVMRFMFGGRHAAPVIARALAGRAG